MRQSETIKAISPALLKAQKVIGAAKKESSNPFFHSKYADLGAVMEACKKELNDNGITVLQPVSSDENGNTYVETVLLHESGEFVSGRMKVEVKEQNNPQAQGAAISYARRYGLQSLVFIPAEDDDAEGAMARKRVEPINGGELKCPLCGAVGKYHKADCPNRQPELVED